MHQHGLTCWLESRPLHFWHQGSLCHEQIIHAQTAPNDVRVRLNCLSPLTRVCGALFTLSGSMGGRQVLRARLGVAIQLAVDVRPHCIVRGIATVVPLSLGFGLSPPINFLERVDLSELMPCQAMKKNLRSCGLPVLWRAVKVQRLHW